jgi:hypothetical protein
MKLHCTVLEHVGAAVERAYKRFARSHVGRRGFSLERRSFVVAAEAEKTSSVGGYLLREAQTKPTVHSFDTVNTVDAKIPGALSNWQATQRSGDAQAGCCCGLHATTALTHRFAVRKSSVVVEVGRCGVQLDGSCKVLPGNVGRRIETHHDLFFCACMAGTKCVCKVASEKCKQDSSTCKKI